MCDEMVEEQLIRTDAKASFWPTPQDYNEALQYPQHSFADLELIAATTVLDRLGIPKPSSGMFACVYQLNQNNSAWAVRCFLRNISDQKLRYSVIGKKLQAAKLSFTVGFDYQERGILINGAWFPILKMEWCPGDLLHVWLTKNINNKESISKTAKTFKQILIDLKRVGIAHGDLQHGNILVDGDQIRLIDYDGMYTPELESLGSHELGHRNYQHPLRGESSYNSELDQFSGWLIYLSLIILSLEPSIWRETGGGDECLIFRRADLLDPSSSELFHLLESHSNYDIRLCAWILRSLLSPDRESSLAIESAPDSMNALYDYCGRPDLSRVSNLPEWMESSNTRALNLSVSNKSRNTTERTSAYEAISSTDDLALSDFPSGLGQLVIPGSCIVDLDSEFTFEYLENYYDEQAKILGSRLPLIIVAYVIAGLCLINGAWQLFLLIASLAFFNSPMITTQSLRYSMGAAANCVKNKKPQPIRLLEIDGTLIKFESGEDLVRNQVTEDVGMALEELHLARTYNAFLIGDQLVALIARKKLIWVLGVVPSSD